LFWQWLGDAPLNTDVLRAGSAVGALPTTSERRGVPELHDNSILGTPYLIMELADIQL
jgi:hypothetical protein